MINTKENKKGNLNYCQAHGQEHICPSVLDGWINAGKIRKAIDFAKKAHKLQLRDDGSPYISHPLVVMKMIQKVTDDQDIICASVLHDVMEDCGVSYDTLRISFGFRVADIVKEVSKNYTHPKDIKSKEAYLIKMADKLHNISTINEIFLK